MNFKRKMLSAGMALGIACAAAPASAALLEFTFTDPYGASKKMHPGYVYVNPAKGMSFAVSAGLDRKVQVQLKNRIDGSIVKTATSGLLTASDRITVDGQEYYGAILTLNDVPEGSYSLATQILSSAGSVIEEETKDLVVDRTPPRLEGTWSFTRGAWGGGDIDNFDYLEQRTIAFEGITDGETWVPRVDFFAELPNSGVERRAVKASYDSTTGKAIYAKPSITDYRYLFHTNRQDYTIGFKAFDRAGNYAETTRVSGFNGECGSVEISHIWNPVSLDWDAYVPAMTAYENPVKFRTRSPLSEHIDTNGRGRWGYNFPISHQDAQYVYRDMTAIKPSAYSYYTFFTDTGYCRSVHMNSVNVTLAEGVEGGPKFTGVAYHVVGEDWTNSATIRRNSPFTVDKLRITAESRSYDQVASVQGRGSCTIPAGATMCEFDTEYTRTAGRDYAIWIEGMGVKPHVGYFYTYWDMNTPEVKYATLDQDEKRVRTQVFDADAVDDWRRGWWWPQIRQVRATNTSTGTVTTLNTVNNYKPNHQTWNDSYDLSALAEGEYNIDFHVKDVYGNELSHPAGTFVQDITAPEVYVNLSGYRQCLLAG